MSGRKVLLIEPDYHNKYPPMGLMKLAMYYRLQGDQVTFWKGNLTTFVVEELTRDFFKCIERAYLFQDISESDRRTRMLQLRMQTPLIWDYIRTGKMTLDSELEDLCEADEILKKWVMEFRARFKNRYYYKNPRWDIVGVTTLFTFYFDITVETIKFAKKICKPAKDGGRVMVGGVLASVVPDALRAATGVEPHVGTIQDAHYQWDPPLPPPYSRTPIDALPLDHSILDEVDYRYPEVDAYYAYSTRGCVNHCPFCVVPILEPQYQEYISLRRRIDFTRDKFGEQRNLLLLDNNVFASKKFGKIIDEIRDAGFARGATYVPPNKLDISISLLRSGWNDRAYVRRTTRILNEYLGSIDPKKCEEKYQRIYSLLADNGLLHEYSATKAALLAVYAVVRKDYESDRSKRPIVRHIDFNQGLDARLATPEKMHKLSEVAIKPLRIAFDKWALRQAYVKAVALAARSGILSLSNYLLYNFQDEPVELYKRLRINIDLCDALGVNIYSFPMKYHPIQDPDWFSNRDYIGDKWSRKEIRAIQSILNSTHGKIGRGRTFFFKAFGRNEKEFEELLRMPEAFIVKRWDSEISGLQDEWRKAYSVLTTNEKKETWKIVRKNVFLESEWSGLSLRCRRYLSFYLKQGQDIPVAKKAKKDRAIKMFEDSVPGALSKECRELLDVLNIQYIRD